MIRSQYILALLALALLVGWPSGSWQSNAAGEQPSLKTAVRLYDDGNYQDALTAFQKLVDDEQSDTAVLVDSFNKALTCFQRLDRVGQIDSFREEAIERHAENWQLLSTAAQSYMNVEHYGYLIAGEFQRGRHRGGGKVMNSTERDRTRALQLFRQALSILNNLPEEQATEPAHQFFIRFADTLIRGRNFREAWRLQRLTDLTDLPDYEEGWGYYSGSPQGAPVTDEGKPLFYSESDSWEKANNDGQRWRWILARLIDWQPQRQNEVLWQRARFLQSQFGVETLIDYGWWFGRQSPEQDQPQETGTFALHTLGENETIARLATGIQRFALPDEHNHIRLLQRILKDTPGAAPTNDWQLAVESLARIFENRRQYPQAATFWAKAAERGNRKKQALLQLDQITDSWGRFEPVMTQPAGKGATVDFRYRNGNRVDFVAHRINVDQLLTDVKDYLKSAPAKLNWDQVHLENLGHRLVTKSQEKYLGEEVARWSLDLDPLNEHFDRRITVTTPLQEPGAYLLTSRMADGNSTSIVLWLADTAIVKKRLAGKALYYVADAVSGKPLEKCNVEFFGFWQENLESNRYHIHTKDFASFTDENGLVQLQADEDNRRHQWVAVATTPEGRFAYLGFNGVWAGERYDRDYQQVKVFTVTDRPVYRPDQELHYKFWVRHAQYDMEDESRFASQSFQVEIRDPKNELVYSTQSIADAYGGISGSWQIPAGATLGPYRINVVNHGGGSFRVEEYKKPEFEVTVEAPDESVALGEKVTAKISAKYYFGSPVTQATVKYKVLRTPLAERWFPPMPWDWLYGPGYWWFSEDYPWYPGWARWGCLGPSPIWFWQAPSPPELVAEREVPIGPDGTIEVEIDTAVAKQFHPDQDQSYQIQAEVVDQSRRTIVGNGRVLVAREPFRVYVWTQRGYYRVGDTIEVGAAARTADGKPVSRSGTMRLLKIQYEEAQPVETEAGSWELATGEDGQAELQIKASESGQFRLAYELTDEAGNKIEGGQIITIAGEGFDGSQFRFNDLELVPNRREYQAGEKVALQINTNRVGAPVLLFLRPTDGVYLLPQIVKLKGKSTVVEIDVTAKDTPNFFVEAVTVHGGRVYTVAKEIFVPPVKRVLGVEVVPSAETYLPNQPAKLTLKLTDAQGLPFVGSLAVSIYDKALDYIAGGSNVADVREFFWKWRRSHRPQTEDNLQQFSGPLVKRNQPTMQNLGVFGDTIVDEIESGSIGNELLGSRTEMKLGVSVRAAPAMAMADGAAGSFDDAKMIAEESAPEPAADTVQPTIRENFADTALWLGALETNAEGLAEVELDMPDNLTTWKIRAWGMGHGTRVGEGSAEVVTSKNVIVRLQAPRFFVERDEVVLSANVHNYLPQEKQLRVVLELLGDCLDGPAEMEQVVTIAAGGEQRVDWRVKAVREGTASIRMSALSDEESDAVEMKFPVYVHGMLKTESYTGVVSPQAERGEFTIAVPSERRAEQTRLEVRYTPTLAGAMVDALPYLLEYPYGCTEQTLNRFLPAVITQQTLKRMNLDLAAIRKKRTNLNAQEIGDDAQRAKDWKRFKQNPVFDEAEMNAIVTASVNRLTQMQLSDGGWGWFSGWGERSYPHTTATVVHGLLVAQDNDVAIVPDVLKRGIAWLEQYQAQQLLRLENWEKDKKPKKQYADNTDALVLMVLTEAQQAGSTQSQSIKPMTEHLYRSRTKLAAYSLATYGIALEQQNEVEKLAMVMQNLSQYVQQDDENQTAWLELGGGQWWYWYGSENEAMAYYLKLLMATEPKNATAPRLVKYLLNNRKHATYWNSTRDTALVVEAFADYLQASGEDEPEVTVEVWIDGQQRRQVSISRDNLFTFDNKLVLTGDELAAGRHTVEIRKQGRSPIYYNGYLTNFTLEDDITAAGLELKVERSYYKLTPVDKLIDVAGGRGQPVAQQVEKYERTQLANFAELESGDLVEVELVVDSKNDYEYILLEDMKAAGFEPVEVRSGYNGNELGAYLELRDDRVSLFVARLARGRHSVSYRLRAEIPGRFSALPTRASAMYAPELKANSNELKLQIVD